MTDEHQWLQARFADIRPRALAALVRRFRDLELAQDCFATACVRALDKWPDEGLPNDPLAWLITVAGNAGIDTLRRQQRIAEKSMLLDQGSELLDDGIEDQLDNQVFRDDILRLLFICCHPDLSPQDQSALALRVVAGLSVAEIASAFLVKRKTMEQRITRAKHTVAKADVAFEPPDLEQRHRRLNTVMLMLYLQFNEGWSASGGNAVIKLPLCEEAIRLARLLLELFPGISELMGLLALFLLQHSRRKARVCDGNLIPLAEQDRSQWDQMQISEASALLDKALRHRTPGTYQIQAAIAAVHSHAATDDATDWEEIEKLYRALYLLEPTPVVKLNHASAVAQVAGPQAALDMLAPLSESLDSYRWFHTAKASFLMDLSQPAEAKSAYQQALELNPTPEERRFIDEKIRACEKSLNPL
jgi:RNA polymerase sigma-70 factor (ECF subfamily)